MANKNQATRLAYLELKKVAVIAVKKPKKESWKTFGEEMEASYWNDNKIFWRTIRRLRNGRKNGVKSVKDKDGNILREDQEILSRWREYFVELLNPPQQDSEGECNEQIESHEDLEAAEILRALKSLKSGKAAGLDEIRPEMRVQAAEMRYLRKVVGVRRIERIRNTTIREYLNVEQLLLKVERSQLRWFGHVLRMPESRLPNRVYSAQPTGRRPVGRPRNRWSDEIKSLRAGRGLLGPGSIQC